MEKTCRFCLDIECNEQIKNTWDPQVFISPCKCIGTQKYVHRGCLEVWRRTGTDAYEKCFVCNTYYKLGKIPLYEKMSCFSEFILVLEATAHFFYLVLSSMLALGMGSILIAVLFGPILGILQPIQKSFEKLTNIPIDQNQLVYTMVIPCGFFLVISGMVVFAYILFKDDVNDEIKHMYLILTLVTFTFGVTLVYTLIFIWMRTNEFITQRRTCRGSVALDFDCNHVPPR